MFGVINFSDVYLTLRGHGTNSTYILLCSLVLMFDFIFYLQIEDEGNHGNDETRSFILSSLAAQNQSRVNCVLCSDVMLVFDRYPLVDGTFFLSPKQYNKNAVEVNV